MKRRSDADLVAGLVTLAIAAILYAALVAMANGQARITDALALARITVHEAGWEDTGDMEAIDAVIRSGSEREGMAYQAWLRVYSRRAHRGETGRRWAMQLTERCDEPPAWPRVTVERDGAVRPHPRWSAYRARCLAVIARAAAVHAGERTHGCPEEPHDWGGDMDREHALSIGLIRIECSRGDVATANDFYLRPSARD